MVYLFFATHWGLSVLMQSLFLHRYAAHRMYTMGPRTERTLHLLTLVTQGSSYLEPRAYALLHREHHAFADTEKDPHSPAHHCNPLRMMLATARRYSAFIKGREQPESRFLGGYPEWPTVDRTFNRWPARILFGGLYTLSTMRPSVAPAHPARRHPSLGASGSGPRACPPINLEAHEARSLRFVRQQESPSAVLSQGPPRVREVRCRAA